jgi:hypothetical protein
MERNFDSDDYNAGIDRTGSSAEWNVEGGSVKGRFKTAHRRNYGGCNSNAEVEEQCLNGLGRLPDLGAMKLVFGRMTSSRRATVSSNSIQLHLTFITYFVNSPKR